MASVTLASCYITSASRYHLRYQSRSSMYIRGLIPRYFAELAEAVPIDSICAKAHINIYPYVFSRVEGQKCYFGLHSDPCGE